MGSKALILGLLALVCIVAAQDANWAVNVSGNWNTAANWNPGVVPTYNSIVEINLDGTYSVAVPGAGYVAQCSSFAVGQTIDPNSNPTLSIESGGTIDYIYPSVVHPFAILDVIGNVAGNSSLLVLGTIQLRGSLASATLSLLNQQVNVTGTIITYPNANAVIQNRGLAIQGTSAHQFQGSVLFNNSQLIAEPATAISLENATILFTNTPTSLFGILSTSGDSPRLDFESSPLTTGPTALVNLQADVFGSFAITETTLSMNDGGEFIIGNNFEAEIYQTNFQMGTSAQMGVNGTATSSLRIFQASVLQMTGDSLLVYNAGSTSIISSSAVIMSGASQVHVLNGATLNLVNGSFSLGEDSGILFTTGTTFNMNSSSITINQATAGINTAASWSAIASNLTFNQGSLTFLTSTTETVFVESHININEASITVLGALNLQTSYFNSNGTIKIGASGSLSIENGQFTLSSGSLNSSGIVGLTTGTFTVEGDAVVVLTEAPILRGDLNFNDQSSFSFSAGGTILGSAVNINDGYVATTAGASPLVISASYVSNTYGTLQIAAPLSLINSIFSMSGGLFTVTSALSFTQNAKLNLVSGTVIFPPSASNFTVIDSTIAVLGGLLSATFPGIYFQNSTFEVGGGLVLFSEPWNFVSSFLDVSAGNFTLAGSSGFKTSTVQITNGVIYFTGDSDTNFIQTPLVVDNGAVVLQATSLILDSSSPITIQSGGLIELQSQSIIYSSGSISNDGYILVDGGFINASDISLTSNSRINITIGIVSALDQPFLTAAGAVVLSGSLSIQFAPQYSAEESQVVELIRGSSISGDFTTKSVGLLTGIPLCTEDVVTSTSFGLKFVKCKAHHGKLSGGAIAGIVITVLIVVAAVPIFIFIIRPRLRNRQAHQKLREDQSLLDRGL